MALGGYLLPAVSDDLLIAPKCRLVGAAADRSDVRTCLHQGIVGDSSAVTPQGSHKSPLVERSSCSIPWQGYFPRGTTF
jgi:hypothetical protein